MKGEHLGITVNELKKLVDEQIAKGNGEKHIIISDDDEGNGFHTLFYGFADEHLEDYLAVEHDGTHTEENCVALG